jgi:hypothetical protein
MPAEQRKKPASPHMGWRVFYVLGNPGCSRITETNNGLVNAASR